MNEFSPRIRAAISAAAALPVVVLYLALARQMQPLPMFDDYPAIFGFGLTFLSLHGFAAKLIQIGASQYGDYKLIFEHLVEALDLAVTGRVHLGFLIWLGNILPIGIGLVLWKMYFPTEANCWKKLVLFLPVIYLIAQ